MMKKVLVFMVMLLLTSITTQAAAPYFEVIDGGFYERYVKVKITFPEGTNLNASAQTDKTNVKLCYDDMDHWRDEETGPGRIELARNRWVTQATRDLYKEYGLESELPNDGEFIIDGNTIIVEFLNFNEYLDIDRSCSPLKFYISMNQFKVNGTNYTEDIYRLEAQPYAKIIDGSPSSGYIKVKATIPFASSISPYGDLSSVIMYDKNHVESVQEKYFQYIDIEGNEFTMVLDNFRHALDDDDVEALGLRLHLVSQSININGYSWDYAMTIPFVDANTVTPDQAFLDDDSGEEAPAHNYFYVENIEDSDMEVKLYDSRTYLEYTLTPDDDDSWTTMTKGVGVTMPSKTKVYMRATENNKTINTYLEFYYNGQRNDGRFNVGGDITTLLSAEGNVDELTENSAFRNMFMNTKVVDASKLILPSTKLSNYCYDQMFKECLELKKAPKVLPATALTYYCYQQMFNNCIKLEDGPEEISATTVDEFCCYYMFRNCKELKNTPELYAQKSAYRCYYWMFDGCDKIDKLVVHLNEYVNADAGAMIPDNYQVKLYLTHKMRETTGDEEIIRNLEPKSIEYIDEPIAMKEDPDHKGDFYTTYYNNTWAFHIPEGLKAYTATITDDSEILLSEIKGNTIPKGEPVVIKYVNEEAQGNKAYSLYVPQTFKTVKKNADNILRGTDVARTAPANSYILSYGQNQLGFYSFNGTLEANKAYIVYAPVAGTKSLSMKFEDGDETTGISLTDEKETTKPIGIYNLQGVRLAQPQKGINIINGKKVLVK